MIRWPFINERGIALPLVLLALVGLGFAATAAAHMSNTDARITSGFIRSNHARSVAEAAIDHGLVELSARSSAGEDPDGIQILSASLDGFTYTVTAFSKREDPGAEGRDLNGDGDRTDVVLYDRSFGYTAASASGAPGDEGLPVKRLVAVATDGHSRSEIQLEVAKDRVKAGIDSPFTLNATTNVVLNGSFDVDGRLYDRDGNLVKSKLLNPPYGDTAESVAAAKSDCNYWKPAIKIPSEGLLTLTGSMSSVGHTAFDHDVLSKKYDDEDDDDEEDDDEEDDDDFDGLSQNYDADDPLSELKFTPEEVLGVEPGALDAYKKPASAVPDFKNLSGINYITSGSVPSNISGSGILIVHNPNFDVRKYDCVNFPTTCKIGYALYPENKPLPLRINSNGNFNGIIITDELIRLNGDFDLLGALISLATYEANIPANGTGHVRWSCEAVQDALAGASDYSIRSWWKEQQD